MMWMSRRPRFVLMTLLLTSSVGLLSAQEPPAPPGPMTGSMPEFTLTKRFSEKWYKYLDGSSKSGMAKFYKYRGKIVAEDSKPDGDLKDILDYEVEKQGAFVYVPDSYDGKTPCGLMLYLSESETGAMPAGWEEALGKHKLIFAAPHKCGDLWTDPLRIAIALDTMETLKQDYRIDEKRIIIAGEGSGAALAQIMGIVWNETFSAIIAQHYGLVMRRTDYAKERDKADRLRQFTGPDETVWDSQASFIKTKTLKNVEKEDVNVVLYTSSGRMYEHERMMFSASHWAQLGVPLLVIDDPNRGAKMTGEWLDKALLFIEGFEIDVPPTRFDAYDLRVDLRKNNRKKKPLPNEKEEAK